MSSPDPGGLRRHLTQALIASAGQSVLFRQALADRVGLNATDLACAGILSESGRLTAGRLAEVTGLTTGAVTGVVDRLERAGYVRRTSDPEDRRRVIVEPIPAQMDRLGEHFAALGDAMDGILASYDEGQLALLLEYFARVQPVMAAETARLRSQSSATGEGDFAAPMGTFDHARLEFAAGAARVIIRADEAMTDLCRAHFQGPAPRIKVQDGIISVRSPGFSPFTWGSRAAELVLNATKPWEIAIRGGVSRIEADLTPLRLLDFDCSGGASELSFRLPPPSGKTRVRIGGGASKISLRRPAGTAASLRVRGGASKVVFDAQRLKSAGGETYLETADYSQATDCYDFEVAGGASKVTIEAR